MVIRALPGLSRGRRLRAYSSGGGTLVPIVPVQHPVPFEGSNSASTISTTASDGTVNTGGFTAIPQVGNCVVLEVHYEDATNSVATVTYTVTDGDGNSFTQLVGTVTGGLAYERIDYWYRNVTVAGTNAARTVTIHKPQASFVEVHIQQYEFSGQKTVRTSATAKGATVSTLACGPTGVAVLNDLVLASSNWNGPGSTYAVGTPAGYTTQYTENNVAALQVVNSCYKTSAGGTESATWTGGNDGANIATQSAAVILVLH